MKRLKQAASASVTLALLALTHVAVLAQGSGAASPTALGAQSLRAYWHVFIAYAIAIVLVLGWVISIGRRLKDVEDRLGQ